MLNLFKLKFSKNQIVSRGAGVIFLTTIAILLIPLWPKISYTINRPDPNKIYYPISFPLSYGQGANDSLNVADNSKLKPIPLENRLVIPKIGVDSEILESKSLDILLSKEGVWREPESSDPEEAGNMMIAGHRFQYLPPNTNTFYNLEDLTDRDKIIVFWDQKSYIYEVYLTQTVFPEETYIRNKNPEVPYEITIYTCTPLYTSEKRFVVKAKLIS